MWERLDAARANITLDPFQVRVFGEILDEKSLRAQLLLPLTHVRIRRRNARDVKSNSHQESVKRTTPECVSKHTPAMIGILATRRRQRRGSRALGCSRTGLLSPRYTRASPSGMAREPRFRRRGDALTTSVACVPGHASPRDRRVRRLGLELQRMRGWTVPARNSLGERARRPPRREARDLPLGTFRGE